MLLAKEDLCVEVVSKWQVVHALPVALIKYQSFEPACMTILQTVPDSHTWRMQQLNACCSVRLDTTSAFNLIA